MLPPSKIVGLQADTQFIEYFNRQLAAMEPDACQQLPNFLIVGPGRTGTTWLARCLSCLPDVFIPPEKELNYFSSTWLRVDLSWYRAFFSAYRDAVKGEASPTYAGLPTSRIRCIAKLIPDVKIVFLLREPVSRAWSEAKHYFLTTTRSFARASDIPPRVLAEFILSDGPLIAGDYRRCLENWLSVFAPEQIFVGFTEEIADRPDRVLERLCVFLGVNTPSDWSSFPLNERANVSSEAEPPAELRGMLVKLFDPRIRRLQPLLESKFEIPLPEAWSSTLQCPVSSAPLLLRDSATACRSYLHDGEFVVAPRQLDLIALSPQQICDAISAGRVFRGQTLSRAEYLATVLFDLDDHWLSGVHNETPMELLLVEPNCFGFNIVLWKNKYFAIDIALGDVDLRQLPDSALNQHVADHRIIEGSTHAEVRDKIQAPRAEPTPPVTLAGETDQYNLVAVPWGAVAVSKDLGNVDLFVERLGERDLPPLVLVARDLKELRARLESAGNNHLPVSLIGEAGDYNLVQAGERVIAVSKALGPVDLFQERLGEREIEPWILIGSTEADLRKRVEGESVVHPSANGPVGVSITNR